MFSSEIYAFPVAVEIFPIGLKMSPKEKSALRCKGSTRSVTLGYSAPTLHRDLKALGQDGSFQPPSPTKTMPLYCCSQSFQKRVK